MTNLQDGHTLVLAGHGCDEGGPYLSLNDVEARAKVRFAVRGKTFTLRRLARRLCTGRFDLQTNESVVCPLDVELLPGSKEDVYKRQSGNRSEPYSRPKKSMAFFMGPGPLANR